jgi:hypothetical protein
MTALPAVLLLGLEQLWRFRPPHLAAASPAVGVVVQWSRDVGASCSDRKDAT